MNINIIGGAGHVGLPLGIVLADSNSNNHVTIYDINQKAVDTINAGKLPFMEGDAQEKLKRVIHKNLIATSEIFSIKKADFIIITIGTPVSENLNSVYKIFDNFLETIKIYLRDGQNLILRSTVYP